MVQFLNATQTFGEIQSIINQATNRSSIVMISPFIKVNNLILDRLIDACKNRNVKITMICREDNLKPDERTRLESIGQNLTLISDEHVHAKCFYNDESMVIGSLNLYDSTTGINHEMGVLLRNDRDSDKEAFQEARNEAQFIMRNAKTRLHQVLEPEPKKGIQPKTSKPQYTSKIDAAPENTFVRERQKPALANNPNGVFPVEKVKVKPIEPNQTGNIPRCKSCGSNKLQVLPGKYGYFYKCSNCDENTAIKKSCFKCGDKLTVRKAANNFFFDCASCNTSVLFYKNTT